jgi:hypothetical protein
MVNNVIQWNVPFSRAVQDWEVKVVMAFFGKLYAFCNHMWRMDSMRWIPSKRHIFEVKSFYNKLACSRIDVASSFPRRSIWKVKVPLRVSFFMWTATLGKTLTMDNLRRKGIIVVGCSMCMHSGESINHLFLHCDVA